MKNSFLLINFTLVILSLISCQPDDSSGAVVSNIRDRAPQAIEDNNVIAGFLENYGFNDKEITTIKSQSDIELIRVRKTDGSPVELSTAQKERFSGESLKEAKGSEGEFLLQSITINEQGQNYTLNYIVIREGEGKSVGKSDDVFLSAEGFSVGDSNITNQSKETVEINEEPFEQSTNSPTWKNGFRLVTSQQTGAIELRANQFRGIYEALSKFKTATPKVIEKPCEVLTIDENGNPTIVNEDSYGIGIIIIPSGLGLYNGQQTNLKSYSNLIYKFDLINNQHNDIDNDGINDFLEGINKGQDTDGDGNQDFNDPDDDNDGTLTRDELVFIKDEDDVDADCDGVATNDIIIDLTNNDYLNNTVK